MARLRDPRQVVVASSEKNLKFFEILATWICSCCVLLVKTFGKGNEFKQRVTRRGARLFFVAGEVRWGHLT